MHLREGSVDLAIDCYDKAIEFGDQEQEGVLLLMRGTALLQRAYASRYFRWPNDKFCKTIPRLLTKSVYSEVSGQSSLPISNSETSTISSIHIQ